MKANIARLAKLLLSPVRVIVGTPDKFLRSSEDRVSNESGSHLLSKHKDSEGIEEGKSTPISLDFKKESGDDEPSDHSGKYISKLLNYSSLLNSNPRVNSWQLKRT